MKTYGFLCGGDRGAWECTANIELSDEEVRTLKEEAKKDEVLSWSMKLDDLFARIAKDIERQNGERPDIDSTVVRIPFEIVRDALKEEGL